jgi:MFS family permease
MKTRIFFGWYIVLAGLILTTFYSAVFTYGWTSFVNPILVTFGWSVTELSLASTFRGVEAGIFNPLWGIAVDRWSLKKLMIIGVIFTCLGIFLISRTQNLYSYYIGFLVMGIAASSVTSMIPNTAIARWFKKDVGKANGLFYMGMGIGGVLVPVITILIDKFGWRDTLLYSAIGFLILGIPLSFVFRQRPEDYGTVPDGKEVSKASLKGQLAKEEPEITMKQAVKMRAFWYFNVVVLYQSAVLSIITLYSMPYLEDLGIKRTGASLIVSLFTIISVGARMPIGALGDVFRKRNVIILTLGLVGASMVFLWLIDGQSPFWLTVIFAVLYGVGISGIMPLRMPFMTEYFGRRNIGSIFGLISVFGTAGSVTAVPLAGWVFDTYHSYKPILLALAVLSIIPIILMVAMPPVSRRN